MVGERFSIISINNMYLNRRSWISILTCVKNVVVLFVC